jgi:two-component system, cell cycle response regulator
VRLFGVVESERPADSNKPTSGARLPSRAEQKTITNESFSLRPPVQRDRAVLVRMDSVQAGQVTSLAGPEIRIGRSPDNALVIDDEGMSRVHARVYYEDGGYYVEDCGSSNGTYVNGARVDRQRLTDGVILQLGPRVCLRFSVTDANQEQILRQLYESSVRDALTGAYNRHFFLERLAAELSYAGRHNSEASLLIFDVDHFKKVNDTHGHLAGDEVLKSIAATTSRLLRTEDVFARYGGEEFVVLLRGVPIRGAQRAGERLRTAIQSAPARTGNLTIEATVSVGCASLACCERLNGDSLIATADRRLYLAKRAGRNRVISEG